MAVKYHFKQSLKKTTYALDVKNEAKQLLKRIKTAHFALYRSYLKFTRADLANLHFVAKTKKKLQSSDAGKKPLRLRIFV